VDANERQNCGFPGFSANKRLAILYSHLNDKTHSSLEKNPIGLCSVSNSFSGSSLQLKDQVAIVTGSGQGIGEATAKHLSKEGANVVVTDLDAGKSDKVASEINSNGGIAISIPGDITDAHFPDILLKKTFE